MKLRHRENRSVQEENTPSGPAADLGNRKASRPSRRHHRHRRWRVLGFVLFTLVLLLVMGRLMLPWAVQDYVNRTLDRNPLYDGAIGQVQIHLLRGAYSIHDFRLSKTTGNVPVPLFAAKRVDFALQWNALLHRRLVGRIVAEQPELNFVDAPSEEGTQTGVGGPWLRMIRDLFPFKINSAIIKNGSVHFRAYQTQKPVDVYLSQLNGSIDNLSNIKGDITPQAATIEATAVAMDQARFEFKMTLDPFSYRPTFHMAVRLLGLDVTKINDLALAYGKFDFKRGWFDLVIEADAKEGQITGYAKPLFRDLKVFSLKEDLQEDNVLQFFWQALVGGATTLLKNQPHDQFGTLIPFSGDESTSTNPDLMATLINILRNAFIRAYLPRLESGQEVVGGLRFEAPEVTEGISTQNDSE